MTVKEQYQFPNPPLASSTTMPVFQDTSAVVARQAEPESRRRKIEQGAAVGVSASSGSANPNPNNNDKLLKAMCKLQVANALAIREMKAALVISYRVGGDHPVIGTMGSQVQDYFKKIDEGIKAGNTREAMEDQLGLTHHQAWGALFVWAIKTARAQTHASSQILEFIKDYETTMNGYTFLEVQEHITHVRARKMYKKEFNKLEVSYASAEAKEFHWTVIHPALISTGGRLLAGTPPMGELERQIQSSLDQM